MNQKNKIAHISTLLCLFVVLGACEKRDSKDQLQKSDQVNKAVLDLPYPTPNAGPDFGHRDIQDPHDKVDKNTADTIVTSEGIENIRFGMTEEEAIKASNGKWKRPEYLSVPSFWEEEKNCYYLGSENSGAALMVYNQEISRIDIWDTKIATETGARPGMDVETIEGLYVNIQYKPNFYSFPIEDLIVKIDEQKKLIFEQDEAGVISSFRIGKMPAIEFVEGCL